MITIHIVRYYWVSPPLEARMFKCNVCGNTAAKPEFVSEVFTIDERHVLVEHIPAQVCSHCGEPTFSHHRTQRCKIAVA